MTDPRAHAVVDRYDNKQYRELYAKPEVVKAVRAGKPIPDGTVLAMAIYSAELDAQGSPVKDEKGRFRKGKQTGVSVTTIGRVARYLTNGNGGYTLAATRSKEVRAS